MQTILVELIWQRYNVTVASVAFGGTGSTSPNNSIYSSCCSVFSGSEWWTVLTLFKLISKQQLSMDNSEGVETILNEQKK